MNLRKILLVLCVNYFLSCNWGGQSNIEKADSATEVRAKSEGTLIFFEGKFVKLEKGTERYYSLFLEDSEDHIITFMTLMPLSEDEIQLLRKSGNNIKLNYVNYFNPVKKITQKLVKSMEPIYEIEKK